MEEDAPTKITFTVILNLFLSFSLSALHMIKRVDFHFRNVVY